MFYFPSSFSSSSWSLVLLLLLLSLLMFIFLLLIICFFSLLLFSYNVYSYVSFFIHMAVSARARSLIYSQSQHFTRWCKKLGLFRCPGFWGAGLARLFYWFELSCACGVWLGRNGSPNWPPNLVLGRRDFPIQFPFTDGSFGSNFIDLTKKWFPNFFLKLRTIQI